MSYRPGLWRIITIVSLLGGTTGLCVLLAQQPVSERIPVIAETSTTSVNTRDASESPDQSLSTTTQVAQETFTQVDSRASVTSDTLVFFEAPTATLQNDSSSSMYFGAFADFGPNEDNVTVVGLKDFEQQVGRHLDWVYFSDNWFTDISFPWEQVTAVREYGAVPYIRIMPRSNFSQRPQTDSYTLQKIADGNYDEALRSWAESARSYGQPLLIEFGTEVNGDWFPWNGRWNGAGQTSYGDSAQYDGPEHFIRAFRHIVDLFEDTGVHNVTWVYHVNALSSPQATWNTISQYYPGDAYVDWIGVSVYGPQNAQDSSVSFTEVFAPAYAEITRLTNKPIAIVEFGVSEKLNSAYKAKWFESMFAQLRSGTYPRVIGLAPWHSSFMYDGVEHNLRLDSSASALAAFKSGLVSSQFQSGGFVESGLLNQ